MIHNVLLDYQKHTASWKLKLIFTLQRTQTHTLARTDTHTQKGRKEKLKFNPAGSDPSDIFIDKCATQSRSSLSSSGGNMVWVILGDTAVRVMIDYSQTELLLLI